MLTNNHKMTANWPKLYKIGPKHHAKGQKLIENSLKGVKTTGGNLIFSLLKYFKIMVNFLIDFSFITVFGD